MKNTTLVVSTLVGFATLGMASVASGAVVVLNSQFAWNAYTAIQGATVATETFESFQLATDHQPRVPPVVRHGPPTLLPVRLLSKSSVVIGSFPPPWAEER